MICWLLFFLSATNPPRSSVWFRSGRGPEMTSSSTPCHSTTFMALLTSCCARSGWVPPVSCCRTSSLRRSLSLSWSKFITVVNTLGHKRHSDTNEVWEVTAKVSLTVKLSGISHLEILCKVCFWADPQFIPHLSVFLYQCFPFPVHFSSSSFLLASSSLPLSSYQSVLLLPFWLSN